METGRVNPFIGWAQTEVPTTFGQVTPCGQPGGPPVFAHPPENEVEAHSRVKPAMDPRVPLPSAWDRLAKF